MKKQSIAIIGVVAFVLAVAIGYALFSDVITIKGTAKANGSFDMDILEVDTDNVKSSGYTKTTGTADIAVLSNDQDTLTITIDKLDYPGAWVEIPVVVKNNGSIPARLVNINQTNFEGTATFEDTSKMLTVTYTGPAASDTLIQPGEEIPMTIKAVWNSNDTLVQTDTEDETSKDLSVTFDVTLTYEQVIAATTAAN